MTAEERATKIAQEIRFGADPKIEVLRLLREKEVAIREADETMKERCAKAIENFKTDNPAQGTSYWGEALASAIRRLE